MTKKPRALKTPLPATSRRGSEPTHPEIRIGYTRPGRETLEAIELELSNELTPPRGNARPPLTSSPEIVLTQTPVGRETFAAIQRELADAPRAALPTDPYGDRIPNAPGAVAPPKVPGAVAPPKVPGAVAPKAPGAVAPKALHVPSRRAPVARAASRGRPRSSRPAAAANTQGAEIFELYTFVVRGVSADAFGAEAARRQFVLTRLRGRVPARSLEAVRRIDVLSWPEENAIVLRLWCAA